MAGEIEAYVGQFSADIRQRLQTLRDLVRVEAPDAVEGLSYGLIGYKLNGKPLVYFGGFAAHVGLYATPNGHEAFADEFARYKQGKGSVQLPLSEPLPLDLVRQVVRYRVDTVSDELPAIGRPATSALAEIGITRTSQLEGRTEKELLALHGFGPKAIRLLREAGVSLDEA